MDEFKILYHDWASNDIAEIRKGIIRRYNDEISAYRVVRQIVVDIQKLYLVPERGRLIGTTDDGCQIRAVTVRKHFIAIFIVDTQCKIVNIMRVVNSRRNITMKLLHK